MYALHFSRLKTRDDVISALTIDEALFDKIIAFEPPPPAAPRSAEPPVPKPEAAVQTIVLREPPVFFRHDIPKKNKARGHRTVWEPVNSMPAYKALARRLEAFFTMLPDYPHECAYGYRPGRNIRENASAHSGNKFLLSLDIKDFFPSITVERVRWLFEAMSIEAYVADLLARFVTIGGALPLGLPTSPVISNMIALPLDDLLRDLAGQYEAVYTRYSDDITFSGNGDLPDIEEIRPVLAAFDFAIADRKTRRSKRGQAHFVTGLSISDPAQPHVPADKKRSLRQTLYFAGKFGLAEHFQHRGINDQKVIQREVNRLDGLVKYVAHHEPRMATSLKEQWRQILADSGMKPSFTPRGQYRAPFYLLVDEAEYRRGDDKMLGLAMAVTQHPQRLADETNGILTRFLADLWSDGNDTALRKNGLHYTDATEDLRSAYVKQLATMPFEGYVAVGPLDADAGYEASYLRLLKALISRRLMAAESQFAFLIIEKNGKVAQDAIKACVQEAFDALKLADNRRPTAFGVNFVAKPNALISVPDFLLGALGKYLQSNPAAPGRPEPRERLLFERLRDKYRLIVDVDPWTEFTRRNPVKPWS
ncbi:reverse transcriptase family protein [Sphingobium sp.]|uniref:reverse transcriptase family protein n=1 Tax=Sphingobium sp. TaxID=1912891 RepID=UPI000C3C1808|nr:reverse transcriptase family protein [Sphingobium sp.]MBS86748.1 RNA-directed DNA polymerase [Sphingobium sp.]